MNMQKTSRLPFVCHRHPEPIIVIILTRLRAHSAVLVTASEADILVSDYRAIYSNTYTLDQLKGSWKKFSQKFMSSMISPTSHKYMHKYRPPYLFIAYFIITMEWTPLFLWFEITQEHVLNYRWKGLYIVPQNSLTHFKIWNAISSVVSVQL